MFAVYKKKSEISFGIEDSVEYLAFNNFMPFITSY